MENIKKVILEAVPEAVIEDKTPLTVTVEPNKLRHLVKALRNYAEMPFDYLAMLTGTDEGEMLMVTYLLCPSTDLSKEIAVKTGTADRVNPLLYTVTDIWETAHYNEREVFAMLGIRLRYT